METHSKKIPPPPTLAKEEGSIGVYVHFPWCLAKCPYCDFLSVAAPKEQIPQQPYTEAVCYEIEQRVSALSSRRVHSVFIGGGTPSLWQPQQLGKVLERLAKRLDFDSSTEVTVECNPSSFSTAHANELCAVGVNRLSIGVQGLDAERLEFLGRLHDGPSALASVRQAIESKIPRVSADLIYGVYRQDPELAAREVAAVASLGVTHLSAYALTIEPGTPFGTRARRGTLPLLDEDLVAESFDAVSETLGSQGFDHYEISNFARDGARCRHNLGYWRGEDYLGVGCGAWGTLRFGEAFVRYRNTTSPSRYVELRDWPLPDPGQPQPAYQAVEALDVQMRLSERILLGMRLAEGIRPEAIETELGVSFFTDERRRALAALERAGRLETKDGRLRIPKSAWLFADAVIRELV